MATAITLGELQELIGRSAQLVEVLPEAEYAEAHLPGAINIPLKGLTAQRLPGSIARAQSLSTAGTRSET